MKRHNTSKLRISRTTIRQLNHLHLRRAQGARNGLSEVVGGCTRATDYFCEPGPATDTNS
jgi:hypothetical protein